MNLQLAQSGCPPTAGQLLYTAGPTLPTISEARTSEAVMECSSGSSSEAGVRDALESPAKEEKKLINSQLKETLEEGNQETVEPKESDKLVEDSMLRNFILQRMNLGHFVFHWK